MCASLQVCLCACVCAVNYLQGFSNERIYICEHEHHQERSDTASQMKCV